MGPDPQLEKPRATEAPIRVFCSVNCNVPNVYSAKQAEVIKRSVPCGRRRTCSLAMRSPDSSKSVNIAKSFALTSQDSGTPQSPISPIRSAVQDVPFSVPETQPTDPEPSFPRSVSDVEPEAEVSGDRHNNPRLAANQKGVMKPKFKASKKAKPPFVCSQSTISSLICRKILFVQCAFKQRLGMYTIDRQRDSKALMPWLSQKFLVILVKQITRS